ncbi:MAG: restriction endonuclease subunit S, partial [bacterium]
MISFSIIQKSQLEGALRLDAEYYQPEYLELEKDLEKFSKKLKTFNDLLENGNSLTGGATPFGADYQDQGIKFLRVQNIMPGYLDFSDIVFIDRNLHEGQLKRSKLINRDVLLTITGVSYGKSAVYKSVFGEVNINQHSVRIYFKNELIPEYVAMFLNSKYGRFQSDRKVTGNTRPALAYEEIRDYKIPLLSKKKQQQIEFLYNESLILDGKSTELYRQAEDLLLKELGLKDFEPEDNLSYVVNFSNTELANRLDAEYFQPKYEKIKLKIKEFEFKELGSIVLIKKGIEPGSEAYQEDGIPFIRVSNISKFGIKDNNQQYLSQEVYDKFKDNFEPKIGEVLLTKDATPGIAYYLDSQIERII